MRKGTRGSIKRAEKLGVEVRRTDAPDDLLAFAKLYKETLDRLERKKGVRAAAVDPFQLAASLQLLTSSGTGRLYLAFAEGAEITGCFFTTFNRSAYYLLNGANGRALQIGGTPLTLLKALEDFAHEGFTRINLGGVAAEAASPASPDHGLYAFKLGLGTSPVSCTSGRLLVRPLRASAVKLALKVRRR
jgi:lipid II:glycine glycyltransferase (peptidoglycan interpeptide bridge formation enzyme)